MNPLPATVVRVVHDTQRPEKLSTFSFLSRVEGARLIAHSIGHELNRLPPRHCRHYLQITQPPAAVLTSTLFTTNQPPHLCRMDATTFLGVEVDLAKT